MVLKGHSKTEVSDAFEFPLEANMIFFCSPVLGLAACHVPISKADVKGLLSSSEPSI